MRYTIIITLISTFLFANLSLEQVATKEIESIHKELFDRYKIPQELQKEEVGLFLQQLDWHWLTIQKDDWRAATVHPARFGKYSDWSDVLLEYYFDVVISEGKYMWGKYYMNGMGLEDISGDLFHIGDMRYECTVTLYTDGQLRSFFPFLLSVCNLLKIKMKE